MKKLILITTSKRRIELLKQIGLEFTVIPPKSVREAIIEGNPIETVIKNAEVKLQSVLTGDLPNNSIMISADTIVVLENGTILGKPFSLQDEIDMLKLLSGKLRPSGRDE